MKKIASKWYFGLIIIPTLINYFTDLVSVNTIFNDWEITIIISQSIIIFVFAYELLKTKKHSPLSEHDIKIVKGLLDTLNIDVFQNQIYAVDSWYGYSKNAIGNIGAFITEAGMLKNRTSNNELNILIKNFTEKLDNFYTEGTHCLFNINDSYSPAKDHDYETNFSNFAPHRDSLNMKTKIAFNELCKLVDFMKLKGIM